MIGQPARKASGPVPGWGRLQLRLQTAPGNSKGAPLLPSKAQGAPGPRVQAEIQVANRHPPAAPSLPIGNCDLRVCEDLRSVETGGKDLRGCTVHGAWPWHSLFIPNRFYFVSLAPCTQAASFLARWLPLISGPRASGQVENWSRSRDLNNWMPRRLIDKRFSGSLGDPSHMVLMRLLLLTTLCGPHWSGRRLQPSAQDE